jgi:hypothetical protein
MGTQPQDPGTQKQATPGAPGAPQEPGKRQDQQRDKRSPQQGKDATDVPTNDDEIAGGTDDVSTDKSKAPNQPRNS